LASETCGPAESCTKPKSHGLAQRPGTNEVWFLDDEWGYLYVYDVSPLPSALPTYLATVPLFADISKPYYRAAKDIKGRSGSFGEIDEAGPMRRMQLGARFSF
jgi:hypothetical protein